jgi:hypothetical protein
MQEPNLQPTSVTGKESVEQMLSVIEAAPVQTQHALIYALQLYSTHFVFYAEKLLTSNGRIISFRFWMYLEFVKQTDILRMVVALINQVGIDKATQMVHSLQPDYKGYL